MKNIENVVVVIVIIYIYICNVLFTKISTKHKLFTGLLDI